jgi:hypothetical protein
VITHYDFETVGDMSGADWLTDHALMIGNSHERIEWDER